MSPDRHPPIDAADPLDAVRHLLSVGRQADAIDALAALYARGRLDDEGRLLASATLRDVGDLAGAAIHAAAVPTTEGWLERARIELHADQLNAAGYAFWRATRLDPLIPEAWAGLWATAIATRHNRAARAARRGLRSIAGRRERRLALAEAWVQAAGAVTRDRICRARTRTQDHSPLQQLLTDAVSELQAQADRHPQRADLQHHLAACHAALGHFRDARLANGLALRINPNYADAKRLHHTLDAAA